MKNILSLSVISTKLAFLACFSLMGTFSSVLAATEVVPPCHQMTMEQESSTSEEHCPACEISQKGWEQQFVNPTDIDTSKLSEVMVIASGWIDFLPEIKETNTVFSAPDPPDEISISHAELIIKNSTVFVI